jgi:hypothetical protein
LINLPLKVGQASYCTSGMPLAWRRRIQSAGLNHSKDKAA